VTDVLLFHHALGQTEGVEAFADRLRSRDHNVEIPDLFDGRRFESIEAGVAYAQQIGFDIITDRGVSSAEGIDHPVVTVGFSLGVLPAQKLAQTNPLVAGAVLCHAAIPLGNFGPTWPQDVPLQIHLAQNDPWATEDLDAAHELVAQAGGSLFLYESSAHLVADSSHGDYDPAIAEQILERTLLLLESTG
jgi:dienelactone hydrolase